MIDKSLASEIARIVKEETIFLRHYEGQVVDINDKLRQGRVALAILDLGFDNNNPIWCWPVMNGMCVPKQGTMVEMYFKNGDKNRPRYLGMAYEYSEQVPKSYNGNRTTQVIYESPDGKNSIVYDEMTGKLTFNGGIEPFVLGNQLISLFVNLYNLHTHPVPSLGTSGPPTSPVIDPTKLISKTIMGN